MISRSNAPSGKLAIEVEIQSEKASALKRVASRLDKLLTELAQVERELYGLSGPARVRCVARHKELRLEAEKQRWYLIVQREAMGLWHHGDIYELYKIPAAVE